MSPIIVDASMTISWLFEDERSEIGEWVMDQVGETGGVVPTLWKLEIANMLRSAVKRKRCTEAFADLALANLARLPIVIDEQTNEHAWGRTRVLSREQGLTLYDAAYLETALRLELPMASNDGDLVRAAKQHSVTVYTALPGPQ